MKGRQKRKRRQEPVPQKLAGIVRQYLQSGEVVEIEGLAVRNGFTFEAEARPRIFIAYVEENLPLVRKLYRRLEAEGYRPWSFVVFWRTPR